MSKIDIHKLKKENMPNATLADRVTNLAQQNLLRSFKNKLIDLANEVTSAINDLYEQDKILEKTIKDKEEKK
jgi:hypothetical protein